jgi:hypothetical protein
VAVRVFISYAHDSAEHIERVRAFWEFLRGCGIDAQLDLEAAARRQDWPEWMEQELTKADFVLVVASPQYKLRAGGQTAPGVGRGVRHESVLLREWLYGDRPTWFPRILPVVLAGGNAEDLPAFLQPASATVYRIAALSVPGAEELLRVLTDQPRELAPALGPMPVLPPRRPSDPPRTPPSGPPKPANPSVPPPALIDELSGSVTVQSEAGRMLLTDLLQDQLGPLPLRGQVTVRAFAVELAMACWRIEGGQAALAQAFRLLEPGAHTDRLRSDAGGTDEGAAVPDARWTLISDLVDELSDVIALQNEGGRQILVEIVSGQLGRPLHLREHTVRRHQDIELSRACVAEQGGVAALAEAVEWLQPHSRTAAALHRLSRTERKSK